jgi:hypothetical protein
LLRLFQIRIINSARRQWFRPVILATQAEVRRIMVQSQPGQIVCETILKKPITKKGLVEWLKW